MQKYVIFFEYVYTFYSFDEELDSDVRTEEFPVNCRFTLNGQEDGSFTVSAPDRDNLGDFVILTYPNKDRLIVRCDRCSEFAYDEFFDSMGDSNHNVYVGAVSLKFVDL